MLFSSMTFLWIFLPVVLIGNYILSHLKFSSEKKRIRYKNTLLLVASLFFYAWGGVYYLFIMIGSILINYLGGLLIHKYEEHKGYKRAALIVILVLNLGMLFVFKYFNMLIVIIESIMQNELGVLGVIQSMLTMQGTGELGFKEIVLPIGISFFTFQSMSYVIDLYFGKVNLQKNLFDFALYVSLFPQLIAGPIVKYSDVETQIKYREESLDLFYSGQRRFVYGLGKKVIFSNTFAEVADAIWSLEISELGTAVAWLGMISYTLQIYYDFSGYSDMAIGIGRMLGFQFKENFNYPYMSCSISEFWRRWHISLSAWFKEYVYIPLGGNRKGKVRTYINLFTVFFLTGIWHGANFTFLVWGLMHGFLSVIERLFLGKWLEKNPIKPLNWLYTILMVIICLVYFRAGNIFEANDYIRQMFTLSVTSNSVFSYISMRFVIILVLAILGAGLIQRILGNKLQKLKEMKAVQILDVLLQCAILIYSIILIVSGTYNPFIYFQF